MDSTLQFARTLLFGTRLEDKLSGPGEFISSGPDRVQAELSLNDVPVFPGRPILLSRPGKATFPALHRLHDPSVRGEVLHFFANHELLAIELMALVLLRFPEAPSEFRRGIVKTIQEEQNHMRLYLSRMTELGVSFGDLPVSDYFWKAMRQMRSPMDFVVQMSLTFEQANLDYSLFYMNAVKAAGDEKTAEVLERVFREEIGHVKHGLVWFNRWRQKSDESEWDAYSRLLPLPMTPQRAKGNGFSVEARKNAGLSDDYIRKLSLFNGSKGRPPVVWWYNPHCDSEIARGSPGFTATQGAQDLSEDLQSIPLFLSSEQDVVLVKEKPSEKWIADLQAAGFKTPELCETLRAPKIGGLEPWGWSPDSFSGFKPFQEKLVDTSDGNSRWTRRLLSNADYAASGIGKLFSKSWSVRFLRDYSDQQLDTVGDVFFDFSEALLFIRNLLSQDLRVMVKAPYGTSGMQVREVREASEVSEDTPLVGWMKKTLASQDEIIVEKFLDKVIDFSTQMEIRRDRIEIFDARFFMTGARHEYRGSYLGKKHPDIPEEIMRFMFTTLESRTRMFRILGEKLRDAGYEGPVGVDSLIYRDEAGALRLKAIVEINPRWTMGRVALELEKKLAPGVAALWLFLRTKSLNQSPEAFARLLQARYPLKMVQAGGGERIQSGAVFTNDPAQAREVLTVMGTFLSRQELLEIK